MAANRSSAVMQQRSEPHDSLDDFPTPPFSTRALCEWLESEGHNLSLMSCREPCANRGHMVKPLSEYFASVEACDVHDYGVGYPVKDYLFGPLPELVDWTVFNPPFRLAEQFIQRALLSSRVGVVTIVRSAFLEGKTRYASLFARTPPHFVLQHVERVIMAKGTLRDPNKKYFDETTGEWKKPSSATAYSWMVWLAQKPTEADTRLRWIAPCRQRLERPSDYDVAA